MKTCHQNNIISVFPRTLPGNILLPWLTESHAEVKLTLCEADFFHLISES